MRHAFWLSVYVAAGCVSTPLRDREDGGVGPPAADVPATDSGVPCRILRGACSSSDPAVACCEVRGWRADPARRCTDPGAGTSETSDTYECQQFPSTQVQCGRPATNLVGYDCYVHRGEGRVLEIIQLQRTLTPAERLARGWEVCDGATLADVGTYGRCPLAGAATR